MNNRKSPVPVKARRKQPKIRFFDRNINNLKRLKRYFFTENVKKLERLKKIIQNYPEFHFRRRQIANYETEEFRNEISSLKTNGYAYFVPSDKLTKELIERCLKRFREIKESDMVPQEGKKFYKDSIRPEDYEPSTSFMRYALDEETLKTVGGYLGCLPFLQSIELIYSTPIEAGEFLRQTHLYHKDKIDKKIVKLFTYITNVDENCGPFTVLPLSTTKKAPWYIEIPGFVTDEILSKHVDLSEAVNFMGPAGSAMMADTQILFHCGSRCQEPRLTFVVHYNSGFSFFPRNPYHERWKDNGIDYGLSKLQEVALGTY